MTPIRKILHKTVTDMPTSNSKYWTHGRAHKPCLLFKINTRIKMRALYNSLSVMRKKPKKSFS